MTQTSDNQPPPSSLFVPAVAQWFPAEDLSHPGSLIWPETIRHGTSRPDKAAIPTGLPQELGGTSGSLTPEHHLAASLASCLGLTILLINRRKSLPVTLQMVEGSVVLEIVPGGTVRIAEVRAHIDFRSENASEVEGTLPLLSTLLARAERHCLVSQAIRAAHPVQISATLDGSLPVSHGQDIKDQTR